MGNGIERRAWILFVIVFLGAAAAAAWYVFLPGRYSTYQIHTADPVSGLTHDAPVEFHGVQVGKVERVTLVNPHLVQVLLGIRHGTPISAATVATVVSRGLSPRGFTGYVYISLEDVGSETGPLIPRPGARFPEIATAPKRSFNLDAIAARLDRLAHSLLDRDTILALKQSALSIQQIAATLAKNNQRLETLIVNATRASHQLTPLLKSSDTTVKVLQTQVLPQAYQALSGLNNLSGSLNQLATELERNPSLLIRGAARPPPGPGEGE